MEDNLTLWAGIVGIALPAAISLVIQTGWSPPTKGFVAFLACVTAAFGTTYFEGDLGRGADLMRAFLIIFTLAISSYRLYWQPTGIAPAIERGVNVAGG